MLFENFVLERSSKLYLYRRKMIVSLGLFRVSGHKFQSQKYVFRVLFVKSMDEPHTPLVI